MYVILVYDIADHNNGAKRWRRVFVICKQYLTHVQNSVFEGDITKSDLLILEGRIKKEIDEELDSVIIFKSRNERWLSKSILGKELEDVRFI